MRPNEKNAIRRVELPENILILAKDGVLNVEVPSDWNGIMTITAGHSTSFYCAESAMGTAMSMSFGSGGAVPAQPRNVVPFAQRALSHSGQEYDFVAKAVLDPIETPSENDPWDNSMRDPREPENPYE